MKHSEFIVPLKKRVRLKEFDAAATGKFRDEEAARAKMERDCAELARLQDMLLAQASHGLLLIFQAMDGAGKDGTIKHVMSSVDPQGCKAYNFKEASEEEAKHDYLWRFHREAPERGQIGIFNRSYYEEVLSTRMHREKLDAQGLPAKLRGKDLWERRFGEINSFERYLVDNGILVLKFFLHLSKEKQRERLLERTELPEKKWKFSMTDVEDRKLWGDYMRMYEDVLNRTSTTYAPWYVVPADHRWFSSLAVADIVVTKLKELKLRYPRAGVEAEADLVKAKRALENE
ncbi:MAG: polyphosphate kinase 2 family protein [Acidobacteriota bacterium]|nr:polyphosphate kinase 2 family protein [Acidobacteriota bacterium]